MPLAPYETADLPERQPLAHTLLSVADVVREADGVPANVFASGVEFRPPLCVDAVLGDPTDADFTRDDGTDDFAAVASSVFLIDLPLLVTARGADLAEYEDEVREAMELATPKAVETQLWAGSAWATGGDGDGPRLADDTSGVVTVLNSGTALAGDGLSDLLDGIAGCGDSTARVIHATPGVVNGWMEAGALVDDGGVLRVAVGGHAVVAGFGYPGSDLSGDAAGEGTSWVHVTHRPRIWLGNIEVHGSPTPSRLSRAAGAQENWVRLWAQRPAIVAFDPCCHLAALVTK